MPHLNGQDCEALDRLIQAFHACPRPEHFTNFSHCDECAEHDQTLRSRTPETLAIEDVGNSASDPICFISPAGFAYFLPGLARLALQNAGMGWYGPQLFQHLISNGPDNKRFTHCSKQQRRAVADFLACLIDANTTRIEAHGAADDAVRAFDIWSSKSGA